MDGNGATTGYEAELWAMADALRGSTDAAEYKYVVLGLIFLKYISDAFEERHAAVLAEWGGEAAEDRDEYIAENIFRVPPEARWAHLKARARSASGSTGGTIRRAKRRLERVLRSNYCAHRFDAQGASDMGKVTATTDVKLIAIGNSRGIRLPKVLLRKYGWSDSLVLQEMDEGVFLYGKQKNKLSWMDTYRAMATDGEDWSDLDETVADGLD